MIDPDTEARDHTGAFEITGENDPFTAGEPADDADDPHAAEVDSCG